MDFLPRMSRTNVNLNVHAHMRVCVRVRACQELIVLGSGLTSPHCKGAPVFPVAAIWTSEEV